MTSSASDTTVIEHAGLLWKPTARATATSEEFVAARTRIRELHADARWNPWVLDDHKAEMDAAMAVFEQWTRAEPGFRPMTSHVRTDAPAAPTPRRLLIHNCGAPAQRVLPILTIPAGHGTGESSSGSG